MNPCRNRAKIFFLALYYILPALELTVTKIRPKNNCWPQWCLSPDEGLICYAWSGSGHVHSGKVSHQDWEPSNVCDDTLQQKVRVQLLFTSLYWTHKLFSDAHGTGTEQQDSDCPCFQHPLHDNGAQFHPLLSETWKMRINSEKAKALNQQKPSNFLKLFLFYFL